jgi:hypothetical protein
VRGGVGEPIQIPSGLLDRLDGGAALGERARRIELRREERRQDATHRNTATPRGAVAASPSAWKRVHGTEEPQRSAARAVLEARERRALRPRIGRRERTMRSPRRDSRFAEIVEKVIMRNRIIVLLATTPFAWACTASFPAPTQRMADAESAERSAREVGADSQPAARLQVKLANEQIAHAKALIAAGENRRADFVLIRAKADAELALDLAREQNANLDTQKAVEQSHVTALAITGGARP